MQRTTSATERAVPAAGQPLIKAYYEDFGSGYLQAGIFDRYPETKTMPAYISRHFSCARVVLDLGFGTGLWFWASFLPSLARLDGIDAEPEALAEADKAFAAETVPEGFRLAHARLGREYRLSDLARLKTRRGYFVFQDYRQPWPAVLTRRRYDLVTEHGGGLGMMRSDEEFIGVVKQAAAVLKPSGHLLFVNFTIKPSTLEKRAGKAPAAAFCLRRDLFVTAVEEAGLRMCDFHASYRPVRMPGIDAFFYGYAEK